MPKSRTIPLRSLTQAPQYERAPFEPATDIASLHDGLAVFSCGPGPGYSIATLFAERGFDKVVVLSRNGSRLQKDTQIREVRTAAYQRESNG